MSGRVIVLGSINIDLILSADRLPQWGETIAARSLDRALGGKGANQAVAACRAGAEVAMVGGVGDGPDGAEYRQVLAGMGVDVSDVRTYPGPTGTAIVLTSPQDNQIVVVAGANGRLDEGALADLRIAPGDVCITQLETPTSLAETFFRRAREAGATRIFNPAPAIPYPDALTELADILIVNETELRAFARIEPGGAMDESVIAGARERLGLGLGQALVVTLGGAGVVIARGSHAERIAGHAVDVVDTTGAGDCFCGYLAAGIARGEELGIAAREANAAAALAVGRLGASDSIPYRASLEQFVGVAGIADTY